ncbi:MAG: metallophosphoesterase [Kiritimatiellae bacterium]|nr:metallophosphoesterase [Kiritimatiellia bacterium]
MQKNAFPRVTSEEAAALKRRLGPASFARRVAREDARELKLGGLLRWCPMRWAAPAARLAFKATGLYGRAHREFLGIVVREEEFALAGLPPELDGFTLLHLSDMHVDLDPALPDAIRAALGRVRGRYDAAVATGDFNNFTVHRDCKALDLVASLRGAFTAPVFGVLGNHDSVRDVPRLERGGVRILLNESVRLRRAGAAGGPSLLLAGVDDPNVFETDDIAAALRGRRPGEPVVLLAHGPSVHREAAAAGVSLVLCGHVHGGQICLPSGRTLAWRHWRFPRHVWRGRWTEGATQGYTTTGVGACGVPLRLNCPPEIVLVRLTRA